MRPTAFTVCLALGAILGLFPAVAEGHPEPADCGTGVEASDSYPSATPVAIPFHCAQGILNSSWDSTDYYQFTCAMGAKIRASITSTNTGINLRAMLPVGPPYFLPPPVAATDTTHGTGAMTFTCTIGGAWRFEVLYGGIESGIFDMTYAMTADPA